MPNWRLLISPTSDPFENMALDEALLVACNKGLSPPTIRFYTWAPPALSIGYSQDPSLEIDVDLCKSLRLPIVRRITGGNALIHYRDLTYSLVFHRDCPSKSVSVSEGYRMINLCVVDAIRKMGVDVELRVEKKEHPTSMPEPSRNEGPFCFFIPARNDIIISGEKVVGSARRILKGAILQHGSIFIDYPPDSLIKVFKDSKNSSFERRADHSLGGYPPSKGFDCKVKDEGSKGVRDGRKPFQNIQAGFTWLNRHLTDKVNSLELQETIVESFERGLCIRFKKGTLSRSEIELKDRLMRERYLKDEWNLHRLDGMQSPV